MRVFVAGGAGAVGVPLVRQLREAGHEVTATTRVASKARHLESLGATAAVVDALDAAALRQAVLDARPEAIIHQLTSLPARYQPDKPAFYTLTSRLRSEATRTLIGAAQEAGAPRFVYQSISFLYQLRGPKVLDESAPVADDAPEPFGDAVRKTIDGERLTLESAGIDGVVLRYAQFYGPGTYFSPDGDFGRRARRRMLPIVGDGSGVFSFLHVEDAAGAAVCALTRGSGVYNIADDEPAALREWVPVFCSAVGAGRPLRVPVWLARISVGSFVTLNLVHSRGAANARAKADLGWTPRHRSWRDGFRTALGPAPATVS